MRFTPSRGGRHKAKALDLFRRNQKKQAPQAGIKAFYQPSEPGSDIWKKYIINRNKEIEYEKFVKIDRDMLMKGCWFELDADTQTEQL